MIAANNNALVFFGIFLAGLLFVPLSVSFMVPEADADHLMVTVTNAPGSSYVGCEETNSCFLPSTVTIDVGGTVTWENPDNVPHTVTSGTSSNGPDGYFDSNLIMVGQSYSNTFDSAGTYTYFCMIHPWMAGTVTVEETSDTTSPVIIVPDDVSIETTDPAGKIFVYDPPAASDNVGVTVGPTCTPTSGTLLPVGVTTISCIASDSSGNTGTASFTVTVVNIAATGDTSPPMLSQLSTIVKETTLSNGAVVTYNHPTATDDEAVTYGPICVPSTGSLFSIGTTTVTCIAKDAAGNQGTSSFDVIVVGPGSTIEESTVSFQLNKSSYFTGDSINVSGISTAENVPVTLQVYSPSVELISVSQVTPGSSAVSQSSGTQATVQNAQGSSFV